ncbi:unnamed protein product [Musa acuminata var. zebrina]
MAVLHADVHAREQVRVQARAVEAPHAGRPLRLRRAVQPSTGGSATRHRWRRARLLRLRHDAVDGLLLLLLRHREDDGRPLRAAFVVSGMTPRTGAFFFSSATVKTVDDHCGLWLPGNLLHALFSNNSADYDVHHQLNGSKYNFSQPFFVMWDRIMRTYMPCSLETRKEGRRRERDSEATAVAGGDRRPVLGGYVGARHMAVLHADVHAREQVRVQARAVEAPHAGRPLRLRRAVQPSTGGSATRHRWRRARLLRLRHDAVDGLLLLLLRHREDDGRPLRAAFVVSGMTPRTGAFFFSSATVKTVDDHCGLWLPGNLLHALFSNNSADYDVHHQLNGSKYNFSQPFFVMWDRIMRTYMPCSLETRKEGRVRSPADQTQELMDPSISCV